MRVDTGSRTVGGVASTVYRLPSVPAPGGCWSFPCVSPCPFPSALFFPLLGFFLPCPSSLVWVALAGLIGFELAAAMFAELVGPFCWLGGYRDLLLCPHRSFLLSRVGCEVQTMDTNPPLPPELQRDNAVQSTSGYTQARWRICPSEPDDVTSKKEMLPCRRSHYILL